VRGTEREKKKGKHLKTGNMGINLNLLNRPLKKRKKPPFLPLARKDLKKAAKEQFGPLQRDGQWGEGENSE